MDFSPGHEPLEDLDISCASRKAVQVPCSQVGGLSIGDFSGIYWWWKKSGKKPVDMENPSLHYIHGFSTSEAFLPRPWNSGDILMYPLPGPMSMPNPYIRPFLCLFMDVNLLESLENTIHTIPWIHCNPEVSGGLWGWNPTQIYGDYNEPLQVTENSYIPWKTMVGRCISCWICSF